MAHLKSGPESSTEPQCPKWLDRRVVGRLVAETFEYEECECQADAKVARLRRYSALPHGDNPRTFGNFDMERQPGAFQAACYFGYQDVDMLGVLALTLSGPNGLGKSHLLEAVGWEMLGQGYIVKYTDVMDLIDRLRSSHNPDNPESLERVVAPYRVADVLLLDDITGERVTDFAREELLRLVKHRIDYDNPMVVTTNLDEDGMIATWGRRLAGRLFDESSKAVRVCRLSGPSYRTGRE